MGRLVELVNVRESEVRMKFESFFLLRGVKCELDAKKITLVIIETPKDFNREFLDRIRIRI